MKKGWETRKLGDVCDFEGGSQPPKSEFIYEEKPGYVRFLQIRDFGSDKNITYIRHSKKNRLCNESDILIGRYGASVGKVLTDKAGAYNVALMKTIPNLEVLDRSWFYSFLISDEFQRPLLNVADRSAQAGFSKDDIYNFPVPPLPQQQRIVCILDEAFEGLATAKANAEKNLQNARALFESHLQSVFTQRGEGWAEKALGDVCEATQGVQIPKSEQSPTLLSGYRRYLYISDFESDKNLKYVPDTYPKKLVTTDDIIVANTGSAGKIFRGIDGILSNNLFKVSFNSGKVDRDFIFFFVTSGLFREHQQKIMRGTANPHMGHVNFKSTPISVPSLETQKVVVAKIHEVSEETQRLESIYQQKLAALEALKKSLLHQAFTGEL